MVGAVRSTANKNHMCHLDNVLAWMAARAEIQTTNKHSLLLTAHTNCFSIFFCLREQFKVIYEIESGNTMKKAKEDDRRKILNGIFG